MGFDNLPLHDDGHNVRDLVQARLLGAIFSHSLRDEIALKGGFAMRVMAGSHRYTKDIDLAASSTMPLRAVQSCIRKAMADLRNIGLVEGLAISEPKQTETVQRWKIGGRIGGHDLHLTVEVSRRAEIQSEDLVRREYSSSAGPVTIACVGLPDLAASKLDCLANPAREAPRDIFDLYLLVKLDVKPSKEAVMAYGEERLRAMRDMVWHKLEKMDYRTAREQLVPFLPEGKASALTEGAWDEMRLAVGEHVVEWIDAALDDDGRKRRTDNAMASLAL